jgi:hypothetical protein
LGFTVYEDNAQIIVALPHVKEYEIKKATQKFDIFAEEYKNLSKKVASIINRSINGDTQVVKVINRRKKMANLEQKKKELEKKEKNLEKNKKEWFEDIKYQIGQIETYLGKIERNPFELDIRDPSNTYYKNDLTGDLEYHLKKMKEIFEKALEEEDSVRTEREDIEEEESDRSAKNFKDVKWGDYQKAVKRFSK